MSASQSCGFQFLPWVFSHPASRLGNWIQAPTSLYVANKDLTLVRNHRNNQVRDYLVATRPDDDSPEWLRKHEFPSSLEIKGEDENATIEEEIEIGVNRVHGAWDSKEQYLETHYRLLREEAVTPLRNAVSEVREDPYMTEKDTCEEAAVYEKVSYRQALYNDLALTLIGLHCWFHVCERWHCRPNLFLD